MKRPLFVRDAIARMAGYVPGEQPAESAKCIKLNTNENPYPPPDSALEAIRRAAGDRLARYPEPTAASFRMAAADVLGVTPEMILCGNGSDELLTILTRAFVGEGERIRYPHPTYVLYQTLAEIQGAVWETVAYDPDWTLPESFADPRDDLRLVFLPNPNSPSGTLIDLETLARWARRLPCPLVIDEAYADFANVTAVPLVSEHANIIVTRTLSKSHALAGLRFGYLVAQPAIVRELGKVKDSYNCDVLSIAGATAAICDRPWLEACTARIVAGRSELESILRRHGFDVVPSKANFVWCRHPVHPARAIYEELKGRGILVRYMDYGDWGDGLRVTVGTPAQIAALDRMLGEILT